MLSQIAVTTLLMFLSLYQKKSKACLDFPLPPPSIWGDYIFPEIWNSTKEFLLRKIMERSEGEDKMFKNEPVFIQSEKRREQR